MNEVSAMRAKEAGCPAFAGQPGGSVWDVKPPESHQSLRPMQCTGVRYIKGIYLRQGVCGWRAILSLGFLSFFSILFIVFVDVMQSFALTDIYDLEADRMGRYVSAVMLVDQAASILFMYLSGLLADIVSRRAVVIVSFMVMGLSVALIPVANDRVYFLLRILFAFGSGGSTTVMTTVLSDYFHPRCMPLVAGFMGISSGLGALCGVSVFGSTLPDSLCLDKTFYLGAGAAAIVSSLSSLAVYETEETSNAESSLRNKKMRGVISVSKEVYAALRDNPRFWVALLAAAGARGASTLASTYLSMWCNFVYKDLNACQQDDLELTVNKCGEDVTNDNKADCLSAYELSSQLGGTVQAVALCCAVVYGVATYYNRGNKRDYNLIIVALISAVSYGVSPLMEGLIRESAILSGTQSGNWKMYLIISFWGVSQMGLIVVAQTMMGIEVYFVDKRLRGTLSSFFSICGTIGIIIVVVLGGLGFELYQPTPFLVLGCLSAVIMIATMSIAWKYPARPLRDVHWPKFATPDSSSSAEVAIHEEESVKTS